MSSRKNIYIGAVIILLVSAIFVVQSGVATSNTESANLSLQSIQADAARWAARGAAYQRVQDGQKAYAARWAALGATNDKVRSGQDADAARWAAMSAANTTGVQRGQEADAARWTAQSKSHLSLGSSPAIDSKLSCLSAEIENWNRLANTSITQNLCGREADAARWNALADAFATPNLLRSRLADAARWAALSSTYQNLDASASSYDPVRSQAADAARWTGLSQKLLNQ